MGLYTSPHVSTFRERMRVNGEMITEKEVEELLNPIMKMAEEHEIAATFFEITTMLAFKFFEIKKVDVAVIEVGIGGRLDSYGLCIVFGKYRTNIIQPELSCIVSIGMDHADILGDTVEKITREKAGIIKYGTPVVIGSTVDKDIINEIAKPLAARVIASDVLGGGQLDYEFENQSIATLCLKNLSLCTLNDAEIMEAVQIRPPCRFEQLVVQNRKVILDVAHNPPAFHALFLKIQQLPRSYDKIHVVTGFSHEKDIGSCLKLIRGSEFELYLVSAPHERAAKVSCMKQFAIDSGVNSTVIADGDIQSTVREIMVSMAENDILLLCGSFYILKDARIALGFKDEIDSFDLHERTKAVTL